MSVEQILIGFVLGLVFGGFILPTARAVVHSWNWVRTFGLPTPDRQERRKKLNGQFDAHLRSELDIGYRPPEIAVRLGGYALTVALRFIWSVSSKLMGRLVGGRLHSADLPLLAESLFDSIVALYPPRFREEFGDDMRDHFRRGLDDNKDQLLPWIAWQILAAGAFAAYNWARSFLAVIRPRSQS